MQTIKTPEGGEMVILPMADYRKLLEAAEEQADTRAYDLARQRLADGEEELVPAEVVDRLLAGDNPIRVWRDHRGLTGSALAEKAGIAAAYLSQIETGKREGKVETLKAIAAALGVTVDDLI
jgi:DNA-binding XRE family transcriptional regulator